VQFKEKEYGGTKQGLGLDDIKSAMVPLPPHEEQRRICTSLDERLRMVSSTTSAVQREISLIRQYRTRLIADVVTGKLDVRAAPARLPDEVEEAEPLDEIESEGDTDEAGADDADEVRKEAEA
jgi:type I restriction enzyme S subunit